jgi:hypothetical protein
MIHLRGDDIPPNIKLVATVTDAPTFVAQGSTDATMDEADYLRHPFPSALLELTTNFPDGSVELAVRETQNQLSEKLVDIAPILMHNDLWKMIPRYFWQRQSWGELVDIGNKKTVLKWFKLQA